ncbi:MAG TPA: class III extradiol dioxygenase family protein [Burkholderiaceae bacterium]|jgi:protocatechuate 4,5-dioxygenase beta chain|nr:class III extradiol dioxygenase family protein [Burkholderiaceae bacterium]
MAKIIGGITTSHVPAIGGAIAKGAQQEAYWKPFFDGYLPVRDWLRKVKPDVAVVISNDHGLNFFLDKMPTFAVGAATEYQNGDEGWGIPSLAPVRGNLDLSWHLIESLVKDEFDITTCQEVMIDHGISLPMALLWPENKDDGKWPVTMVPVFLNTVQSPLPSPARCYKLGQAIGRAVESWDSDARVVIIGTGGLSHQLDGERAGHINKEFDLKFMDSMVNDPTWATRYSEHELVELAGTQGVEIIMWMAARAAMPERVRKLHSNYHVPISNTATGVMLMETF